MMSLRGIPVRLAAPKVLTVFDQFLPHQDLWVCQKQTQQFQSSIALTRRKLDYL